MKYLIPVILSLFIFSCSEEAQLPEPDVYQIKDIGILATSEYTLGKVIKLSDPPEWYKLGDRKILISTKAKVKTGCDLSQLKEGDIEVIGNKIKITLPNVSLTSFEMNPDDIRTEMKNISGFRSDFSQEEVNKILKLGEQAIRAEVMKTNILKDAEENTKEFITNFYKDLGFEDVIVEYKD